MAIEERMQFTASDENDGSDSRGSSSLAKTTPTKTTPTKLYVGNLSMKTSGYDLRRLFEKYGQVSDVDVVGNFAFIVMPNEAEAEEAIKGLHDVNVEDKKLVVEKKRTARRPASTSTTRRGPDVQSRSGRAPYRDIQLFVARVRELSEDQIKQVFAKFGDVVNVQKPKTKPDIAFVSMENFFEARKAIESLNKKVVEGLSRSIFVQLATSNVTRDGIPLQALLERGETIKIFVRNLDKETTDAKALGVLFERYGPVFDVAIIKDKGFGFVHMLSRESAEDAVRGLNRRDFKGKPLSVTFSVKKGMVIGNGGGRQMERPFMGGGVAPGGIDRRLGARSMMPRGMTSMNRGNEGVVAPPRLPPPHADPLLFVDDMFDPLLALQRQINSQYLANRGVGGFDALRDGFDPLSDRGRGGFDGQPLPADRPRFGGMNPDASPFSPRRDLPAFGLQSPRLGGASAAAHPLSPLRPRDSILFPAEDRSRYANFAGGPSGLRSPPQKRDRSPLSQQRSSPKKRSFMADDLADDDAGQHRNRGVRFAFGGHSPSRDGMMNASESGMMRRNAAKSVPPKMFHQRIF